MAAINRHGLSRHIPSEVKREVRRRSKFGCIVCRQGFYQYEHIDPPFEDATSHDPEHICCLCGTCHDAVTRGLLSKELVQSKYQSIQEQSTESVDPPTGPLDFHDGSAELFIGGLLYSPAVRTVLRYHGQDLIRVDPGGPDEPGKISAIFTNDEGQEVLRLEENEWIGSLDNWDIDVVGPRITVRRKHKEIVLRLRLDPPGRIVVEKLDMRIADAHILFSEETYAVGRYDENGDIHWVHADIRILHSSPSGAAIEFTDVGTLRFRSDLFEGIGQEMADSGRNIVINGNAGVMVIPLGIVIASNSGTFALHKYCIGQQSLEKVRRAIFENPENLCQVIAPNSTN